MYWIVLGIAILAVAIGFINMYTINLMQRTQNILLNQKRVDELRIKDD